MRVKRTCSGGDSATGTGPKRAYYARLVSGLQIVLQRAAAAAACCGDRDATACAEPQLARHGSTANNQGAARLLCQFQARTSSRGGSPAEQGGALDRNPKPPFLNCGSTKCLSL